MKLNFIKYHILPIVSSLLIVFIIGFFIFDNNPDTIDLVKGNQEETTRIQANYSNGIQGEINFVSSLLNKNNICFLGSSEFGNPAVKYYPYNFLKDTLNTRVFAFGHAHHQCFSIYSQLVANQQELKNSNICIILSPSWFITEGTNIEAFIEFVPENYLKRISISLVPYLLPQMIHLNQKIFKINNNKLNFKKLFFQLRGIIES